MAKPKLSTILWLLVCVALIVIVLALSTKLVSVTSTLEERNQEITALTGEKMELEAELERVRGDNDDLEARLAAMDEEVRALTASMNAVRSREKRAFDDMTAVKRQFDVVKREKDAMSVELVKVKKDYESAKNLLDEVRQAKEALEAKVKEFMAKKEVELEKIEVTPEEMQYPAELPAPLQGEVLNVNREYNFVVINLGEADGVGVGAAFEVMKGKKKVGVVQVEKVYEKMSAASIVTEQRKNIAKGCAVKSL
ncbi:MAG: hypothetical protein ABIH01_04860 [Candidatus Omnitrophota bacterium]